MNTDPPYTDQGFSIVARVIRQEGYCAAGHQVGDQVLFDGLTVQGKICIHALYSFLPKVLAMRYGAEFPWLTDQDVATHACPDAWNPVVFEIRRLRQGQLEGRMDLSRPLPRSGKERNAQDDH